MLQNIKNTIYKNKLFRKLYEKTLLNLCKKVEFLEENLTYKIDTDKILKDENIQKKFFEIDKEIKKLELPNLTGGLSPDDQRLLCNIINVFNPKKVLEIGTHIGSSTVSIALAMHEKNTEYFIKTVDLKDVNDEIKKPWLDFKSNNSPRNNLKFLNVDKFVEFKKSDSLNFLKEETEKYDFIFLDGSHRADYVYKELALASQLLNPNGVILLHDYYENSNPIPGPHEAFKRANKENKLIGIYNFANLPWIKKSNGCDSSIAILYKKLNVI